MTERSVWGSRLGFILASAGSAVGLGAIWKFPYMAGTNGGSIFMLPYIFFTVTIGLTLLIGEMCMGRSVRAGAAGAFRRLGGPFTGIIGYISVLTGFLVLAFYSVVGGWCVYYMIQAFMGNGIINDPSMMRGAFESFASSDVAPVLSHLTFLGATAFVVYFGVEKGIERVSKVLMPLHRIGPAAFGRKENDGLVVGDGHARLALHRDLDGRRHRILPFGEDGSG